MSNAFASTVFLFRNTEKVKHGDIGRAPVVGAQTVSTVNKIRQIDGAVGKSTQSAVSALGLSEKALNFAGNLVNPLIVASSALKISQAEDKEAASFHEAGGLGVMFASEHLMKKAGVKDILKKYGDDIGEASVKRISKVLKLTNESSNKSIKIISGLLTGIAFVGASITGYSLGAKAGDEVIEAKRNSSKIAESNQLDLNESPKRTFSIES